MLEAIHKKTFDETGNDIQSGYPASLIWSKFLNPNEEEWVCCPICQKTVTPVKPHQRILNKGTPIEEETTVISYFRIKDGESGGCATGESDEHKRAKILIATLIENQKTTLKIGQSTIPYSSLNIKTVPRIPFRWEQKRLDRRADVLFEFNEWHPILGQGIVFEVQTYTLPEEEKNKREMDWVCNGYSLSWLPIELFADDGLTKNEIIINNPWSLKLTKINSELTNYTKNLLYELISEKQKYEDRRLKTCRTCIQSSQDKDNEEILVCWYGTQWGKTQDSKGYARYPTKHEELDTCERHQSKSW